MLQEPQGIDIQPVLAEPSQQIIHPGLSSAVPVFEPINKKPKFIKSKLFVGLMLALIIIPLCGGSAFATMSWYQDPQKVIADSFVNAITAKSSIYTGTYTYSDTSSKFSVTIDVNTKRANATGNLDVKMTVKYDSTEYNISSAGLVDARGDIYFKVIGLADVVKKADSQLGFNSMTSLNTAINNFVSKVDGTWIRISNDDLKTYSDSYVTSKDCLINTYKKYQNDQKAIGEISDLYRKNPLIVVDKKLGIKNGSFGYEVKASSENGRAFVSGFANTQVYKTLHQCDDSYTIKTDEVDSEINNYKTSTQASTDKDSKLSIWIDMWSHNITKIEANGKNDTSIYSAVITPKYNQEVNIVAPTSSMSLTELKSAIQDLSTEYMSLMSSNY